MIVRLCLEVQNNGTHICKPALGEHSQTRLWIEGVFSSGLDCFESQLPKSTPFDANLVRAWESRGLIRNECVFAR
jgi:hypothetical protein